MDAVQPDDVGVPFEREQEHDFTEGALGVGLVAEGVEDLFDGDNFFGFPVDCLPDDSVGPFAKPLLDVESLHDVFVDL